VKSLGLEQRPTTANLLDPATTGHDFPAAIDRVPWTCRESSAAAQFPDDVPSNATMVHAFSRARGQPRPNEVALACMTSLWICLGDRSAPGFPKDAKTCVPVASWVIELCATISIPSYAKCGANPRMQILPCNYPKILSTVHFLTSLACNTLSIKPQCDRPRPPLPVCVIICATCEIPSFTWRHARRLAHY
jgi:hypothetical protein